MWFDEENMQSVFWINEKWANQILSITGDFAMTALTAEAYNNNIETIDIGDEKYAKRIDDHNGWLFQDGRTFLVDEYPRLYNFLVLHCGYQSGQTSFSIPDTRGMFARCVDGGRGLDSDSHARTAMVSGGNTGDKVNTYQGDAIRNIVGRIFGSNNASSQFMGDSIFTYGAFSQDGSASKYGIESDSSVSWGIRNIYFDASRVVPTGSDNRPTNFTTGFFIYAGKKYNVNRR